MHVTYCHIDYQTKDTCSVSTVVRARRDLGWVCKRTRYCAMISANNKRLELCKLQVKDETDLAFENVIWSDESSVQQDVIS